MCFKVSLLKEILWSHISLTPKLLSFILLFWSYNSIAQNKTKQTDSLIEAANNMLPSAEKVEAYSNLGYKYRTISVPTAKKYLLKAINLGSKINEQKFSLISFGQMALIYANATMSDSTEHYLDQMLDLVKKENSPMSWSNYYQIKMLVAKRRNDFKQAEQYAEKALAYLLKDSLSNTSFAAGAYINLANAKFGLNKYEEAIQNIYKALKIFNEEKNEKGISFCYNNLASIYMALDQHEDAIIYIKKSIALKDKNKDEYGLSTGYQQLSATYYNLKEYQNSLKYINISIALNLKFNNQVRLINNYWQKAKSYTQLGDTLQAEINYNKAITISKKLKNDDTYKEIEFDRNKLKAVFEESKVKDLLESLAKYRNENDTAKTLKTLENIAGFYLIKKNYEEAYNFKEEYSQLNDIVLNKDLVKELRKMENTYEIQQKENEIELLQKDKELQAASIHKRTFGMIAAIVLTILVVIIAFLLINRIRILQEKKRLEAIENMRKEIASDLHDDIGSTLSSIQIISTLLQQQEKNNKIKESAENINNLSTKIANGIREIVWSLNSENDDLGSTIIQLKKITDETLLSDQIKYSFIDDIMEPNKKLLPTVRKDFMMIFKEAINNSRKHGNSQNISICIKQSNNTVSLEVKDDGCGFNYSKCKRGNGLFNIERRAKKLDGNLTINSMTDIGTTVSLSFPLP